MTWDAGRNLEGMTKATRVQPGCEIRWRHRSGRNQDQLGIKQSKMVVSSNNHDVRSRLNAFFPRYLGACGGKRRQWVARDLSRRKSPRSNKGAAGRAE